MTDSEPRRIGVSIELKPHAYDPVANPELFDGVLARRLIAFLIDLIIIAIPVVLAGVFMAAATIATLGIAAIFFAFLSPLFWPLIVIWAIVYYGITFGSAASATIGMRVMDLEMRTWYGSPAYFVLGAVHAVVFWLSISFLTPLVLLVCFFNERRRLLHDMVIGTIVINNPTRAQLLRNPARP
ncbi:MAG: RDD family protein [Xanthobacteraceae bacterium]